MKKDPHGFKLATLGGATLVAALLTLSAVPAQALDVRALCEVLGTCVPPHEGKAGCWWEHVGPTVPVGGVAGVPPGTSTLNQVITLHCPNHIELGALQYGWKECVDPLTGADCSTSTGLSVVDLGRSDDGTPCGFSRSWEVVAPNFNLYRAWFRVHTLKDADCDKKPDDWNHDVWRDCPASECQGLYDQPEPKVWRQNNDGSVVNYGDGALDGNPCYYDNTFYSGRDLYNKPRSAGGSIDPRWWGYFPQPDREINECDWQTWEYQWRQYN